MRTAQMNINQLREYAVKLGADKKKLYGTSRQALLLVISRLERGEQK